MTNLYLGLLVIVLSRPLLFICVSCEFLVLPACNTCQATDFSLSTRKTYCVTYTI